MIISFNTLSVGSIIIGLVIGLFISWVTYISAKRKKSSSQSLNFIIAEIEKMDKNIRETYKVVENNLKSTHKTLNDFYAFFGELNDKTKRG